MLYKYVIIMLSLFALAVSAQAVSNFYYTGYWTVDSGIRLYNICCVGVVQLPDNSIRVYAQSQGNIFAYLSNDGLNFSQEYQQVIRGGAANSSNKPAVVIMANGTYRIYYTVSNGTNSRRIYTATSETGFLFSNATPISDYGDPSFNNATGFASVPSAGVFPNDTIGLYYVYTSSHNPVQPCGSLYMFATSEDGVHFSNKGCVKFSYGKSYNFVDPSWAVLPNSSIILVSATQSPIFNPPGTASGLYVSYSTDNTLLNFTEPKLIITPPAASLSNSIDLLQDPDIVHLADGTYKLYYNIYPAARGSNYATPSDYVYIASASWIPIPHAASSTYSTSSTTVSTTASSTSATTVHMNTTASTTIQVHMKSGTHSDTYAIIIGAAAAIIIIAIAVYLYYLSRRNV